MRIALATAAALVLGWTGAAVAESAYTPLDLETCEIVRTYETGEADRRCEGYAGIPVFVSDGDARQDVDFGTRNDNFESFFAFNGAGDTVEWMLDADGNPYAAAIRFIIDTDGRVANALVVSRIGTEAAPGCVVGIVDAAAEQANGIARGLGAMAKLFDCTRDSVVIVPGAGELVAGFSGQNG